MRSVSSAHLLATDGIHLRGVTTEEEIEEEIVSEIVFVKGPFYQKHSIEKDQQKVFLCSSCQGRGELWMKGFCFGSETFVNTNVYGLWREDGSMEVICVCMCLLNKS